MKDPGIYKIVCLKNNNIYIGSTENLSRRKVQHFTQLQKGEHINKKLQKDYLTFGEDSFSFKVIKECPVQLLSLLEQKFIDLYNPFYNIIKKIGNRKAIFEKKFECKYAEKKTIRRIKFKFGKKTIEYCSKIPLSKSEVKKIIELEKIRLKISCS